LDADLGVMDIHLGQQRLEAYFKTFNAGDEAAHLALFHPDVVFFASGSGAARGRVAVLGVYHSAKRGLDILRMQPMETYGLHPEMAVRVELSGQAKRFQAMFVFRFDEDGAITRLSILYNLREAFGG
jgi:ketosteroid isomerase-like protein